MKKYLFSKLLIALFTSATFFSFILFHNVEAVSTATTNLQEEEQILKYDAITGKITVVDMEELKRVVSLYSRNSDDANKVEGYTPNYTINNASFNSSTMPTMNDSKYETVATRITDTVPVPYSKVLKVTCSGGAATAYLVGPKAAMTSAHCVFDENNNNAFFTDWTCYAAYSDGFYLGSPTGWSQVYFSSKWKETHDPQYDWAICVLQADFSKVVGWFGTTITSDSELSNMNVTVLGYPSNPTYGYKGLYQYKTGYKVKKVATYGFTYGAYTVGGFSGSPIIRDTDNYVVGVHHGSNSNFLAYGVRITSEMISIIKNINNS